MACHAIVRLLARALNLTLLFVFIASTGILMKRHFITFYFIEPKGYVTAQRKNGYFCVGCHSGRKNKGSKRKNYCRWMSTSGWNWIEMLLFFYWLSPAVFFHRAKTMPLSCYLRSLGNSPKVIKMKHAIGCAVAWCWREQRRASVESDDVIFSRKLILFNARSSSGYINNFIWEGGSESIHNGQFRLITSTVIAGWRWI